MNSSGIKRGLAATAVAALAVTGGPFLASGAFASTITQQNGTDDVTLYSQYSGTASVQNDGTNTTVHLLAGGGSNVQQVRFSYSVNGGAAVTIGTVSRTNDVFSYEWAPPASLYGQTVDITATGLNAVGNPNAGSTDTEPNVTIDANASAVDISNAPGSSVPTFAQPYAAPNDATLGTISGTASTTDPVDLTDQTDGGPATTVTPGADKTFSGAVDFSGYAFNQPANSANEVIVGAANDSDDAETVTLSQQTITTVTATPTNTTIPDNGSTATGTVTVTDQNGKPIAGAQVVLDANNNNVDDAGDQVKYTGTDGTAQFTGLTGTSTGKTYNFYVNTTGNTAYEAGTDFKRQITVTTQAQTLTGLTASSNDGSAFDIDEYMQGDLTAKLVDQGGNPVPNTTVSYKLTSTPFTTPPAGSPAQVPVTGTATTNANGVATIPVTAQQLQTLGYGTYTLATYIDRDGTPGQTAGDLVGTPLTFKAGDSTLKFQQTSPNSEAAGSTDTFSTTLTLEDGTALVGRRVNFTYAAGNNGDSQVAAQANQPAGTTQDSTTTAHATTDANGVAKVAIADPSANASELGAQLSAATGNVPNIGNPAESAGPITVNFATSTTTGAATIVVSSDAVASRPGENSVPNNGTETVTVTSDADNNPATAPTAAAGVLVTLTTDHGYFTDGTAAKPVAGQPTGELTNLGKSIQVVTDANGQATYRLSIGRDAGFDDDGKVDAKVTATVGTATGSGTVAFDDSNPLNGGTVSLDESDAQDNPTDPTPTNSGTPGSGAYVGYDVTVTDQFGNTVGGEDVTITDDSATADESTNTVTTDFDPAPDFLVEDSADETVTITATYAAPVTNYTTSTGTGSPAPAAPKTVTDTATAEFYTPDFDQYTFSITHTPTGTLAVGTAVTETVTVVDQKGNPVEGLAVQFLRSGPGDQTGDTNAEAFTNADGQAFYNFVGTEKGTAKVSAVISDSFTQPTEQKIVNDSVTFGTPAKLDVKVKIFAPSNGPANDKVKVKVGPNAAGAKITLFKVVNGQKKQIKTGNLNTDGIKTFIVKDTNGAKPTYYQAHADATAKTNAATSGRHFTK